MLDSGYGVLSELSRGWWWFLLLSLAYGLTGMALMEFIKDMRLRRSFNRTEIIRRLKDASLRKELIALATAGDENAFFDLPIDKLAGQVNAAALAVLENAKDHEALLRVMARGASESDISTVVTSDTSQWKSQSLDKLQPTSAEAMAKFNDARTRVAHHVQRTIDALQISVSNKWRRKLQLLSLLLSVVIGVIPILLLWKPGTHVDLIAISVSAAILGGFLAPLVKDVLAQAQQKT
jgi:hypothetical protein